MTYQPLHQKYRPQTFADLVGQMAIATTLINAIRRNRIAPAYLFTGPRGTGKTSSARILAKSLNCLASDVPTESPCGLCDVCQGISKDAILDVVEIDAASNTGVDNIRELIERAQFAPVQCRYKVYVIDEVHMLSVSAFNALLKTLEEPPKSVVFVLATTDPQRVLPTIISRCQRFDFRRIPLNDMVTHLRWIADQEKIDIAEDAIQIVAQIAQGGLRDAESLLDQLSLFTGQITVERVWNLVGAVPEQDLLALLKVLEIGESTQVLECVRNLLDRGREPLIVLQNLAGFYRDLLIAKVTPERGDLVTLTSHTWDKLCEFARSWDTDLILAAQKHLRESEGQLKNTTQPRLWLEIILLGLLPAALRQAPPAPPPSPVPYSASVSPAPTPQFSVPSPAPVPPPPPMTPPAVHPVPGASPVPVGTDLDQIWQQVLQQMTPAATQALMRQHGRLLEFNGEVVRIGIRTPALLKIVLDKASNVEMAFQQVFNQSVKVRLEVAEAGKTEGGETAPPQTQNPAAPAPVSSPPLIRDNHQNGGNSTPLAQEICISPVQSAPSPPAPGESLLNVAVQRLVEVFQGEVLKSHTLAPVQRETFSENRRENREVPGSSSISFSDLQSKAPELDEEDDRDDHEELPF